MICFVYLKLFKNNKKGTMFSDPPCVGSSTLLEENLEPSVVQKMN